jgi:predicted HTH domain antitoxin
MTVAIEIPDDLERQLNTGWSDLPRRVLEAVALEAYRSGVFTSAEVGRLLGFESRWDTETFLQQHGACLDYTEDDLARDTAALRRAGI